MFELNILSKYTKFQIDQFKLPLKIAYHKNPLCPLIKKITFHDN